MDSDNSTTIRRAALILFVMALPSPGWGWSGLPAFEPVREMCHVRTIRSSRAEYSIDVGGTVDMDNTTTRRYETFEIAFQNNVSLTIANTGSTTVTNPRVITNDKRR